MPLHGSVARYSPLAHDVAQGSQVAVDVARLVQVPLMNVLPVQTAHTPHAVAPVPAGANRPSGHAKHAVAPGLSWYSPFPQALHVCRAVRSWNWPGAHAMHSDDPAFLALRPTGQAVQTSAASSAEKRPAAHSLHVVFPICPWNLPAMQLVHAVAVVVVE
jgi:hypothetical protein